MTASASNAMNTSVAQEASSMNQELNHRHKVT